MLFFGRKIKMVGCERESKELRLEKSRLKIELRFDKVYAMFRAK